MQLKLKFETIEDIKNFGSKVQTLKLQLLQFQGTTVLKIARNKTLHLIHQRMRAAGFSQKIIDGTTLFNVEFKGPKKVRLHFRSEYFADTGFDVALAREKGTKTHEVRAGEGKTLPIPTDNGLIFRKSANPSGIVALMIVATTVSETEEAVQDQYSRELLDWYAANLGGIAVANR